MSTNEKRALLCIDLINDIVDPAGKLAGKGYPKFAETHGSLANIAKAQSRIREEGSLLVHVRVGFSPNYTEHPAGSPLFGRAKEFQALRLGGWGTEFSDTVQPAPGEPVVIKHRVSSFYGTDLEVVLRAQGIHTVLIAGVATDLAVESAAREAHDRDYRVIVLSDCCIAANEDDHTRSLELVKKIGTVATLDIWE